MTEFERLVNLGEIEVKFNHIKEYSVYNYNYYKIEHLAIGLYDTILIKWTDDNYYPDKVVLGKINGYKLTDTRLGKRNVLDFEEIGYLDNIDYPNEGNTIALNTLRNEIYY